MDGLVGVLSSRTSNAARLLSGPRDSPPGVKRTPFLGFGGLDDSLDGLALDSVLGSVEPLSAPEMEVWGCSGEAMFMQILA